MKLQPGICVALFLALGSPLLAQSDPTADALLQQVNQSPITKALGITKVEKTSDGYAARLDKISEPVYLFLGSDGKTLNAAVALQGWNLAGVAAIHAPVVVVSTGANSVAADKLPAPLKPGTLDAVVNGKLVLREGVNLFAGLDLSDKATLAAGILSSVLGAPAQRIPISGPLGTAVLDAIVRGETPDKSRLAGMKLDFTLPWLRPVGLEKYLHAENVGLSLVSKDGGVSLEGSFDLTFSVGSPLTLPKIQIKEFRASAPAGQPVLSLAGGFPRVPDLLSKIPGLVTKELAFTLDVTPDAKGSNTTRVSVAGSGTLRKQPITVALTLDTAAPDLAPEVSVTSKLTLAALIDHPVPVFGDIVFDELDFVDGLPGGKLTLDGKTVTVTGFHVGGADAVALGLDRLSLATFAPSLSSGPLDGIRIVNPTIVFVPKGAGGALPKGGLPKLLQDALGPNLADYLDGDSLNLREGLTFFGLVEMTGLKPVKDALDFLGISTAAPPLMLNLPLVQPPAGGTGLSLRITLPKLKGGKLPSFFKGDAPRIVTRPVGGGIHPILELPVDFLANLPGGPASAPVPFILDFDLAALANREFVCTGREAGGQTWHNPFGIPFTAIDDCTIDLDLSKGKQHFSIGGVFAAGHAKGHRVDGSIDLANGAINDVSISLPDTTFSLGDLPELSHIPNISTFSLKAPAFSLHSFAGVISFRKIDVDLVIFQDATKTWNALIHLKDRLNLGALLQTDNPILKELTLPDMCLIVSESGFQQRFSQLPPSVQSRMPGNSPDSLVFFQNGVSLSLTFDLKSMRKDVREHLSKLGINSNMTVTGGIMGVFTGAPGFSLSAPMLSPPKQLFKSLKWAKDASFRLCLDFDLQRGFGVGFGTYISVNAGRGKDPLLFDSKVEVKVGPEGVEVSVTGEMQGTWHEPLDVKGMSIGNLHLDVGVREDLSLDFSIWGTFGWNMSDGSHQKMTLALSTVLSSEAEFVPTAIGIGATLEKIPLYGLYDLGQAIALASHGGSMKGDSPRHLQVEIRKFAFGLMTPGAELPPCLTQAFDMGTAGIGLEGELWLVDPKTKKDKFIGKVNGHMSDRSIHLEGAVGDLAVGPVHLNGMSLLFQAGIDVMPELGFSGKGTVGAAPHAFSEDMKLVLQPTHFELHMKTAVGAKEVVIDAESGGLSPDPNNDFTFSLSVKDDFSAALRTALGDSLKALKDADAEFKQASQDVANRQKEVASWQDQIDARRKVVQKSIDDRRKTIQGYDKQIKQYDDLIAKYQGEANSHAAKSKKYTEELKPGPALDELNKAKDCEAKVASTGTKREEVVACRTKEQAIKLVATPDDDPKVLELEASKKSAQQMLAGAQLLLSRLEKAGQGLESAVTEVQKATGNLQINEITFAGSVRGLIPGAGGQAPSITIDGTWKGGSRPQPLHVVVSAADKAAQGLVKSVADALAAQLKKILLD